MFKFLRNIFSKEAEASWVHCGTYLDTNHYYAADDCHCVNCVPDRPAYYLVKVFKKHTRDNKWQMKETIFALSLEEYQGYSKKIPNTLMPPPIS